MKFFNVARGYCHSVSEKQCRTIAKLHKVPFVKNSNMLKYPKGCYHKKAFQRVYYNDKPSKKQCDKNRICMCTDKGIHSSFVFSFVLFLELRENRWSFHLSLNFHTYWYVSYYLEEVMHGLLWLLYLLKYRSPGYIFVARKKSKIFTVPERTQSALYMVLIYW